MGGAVILEGRHILERALLPPPRSPYLSRVMNNQLPINLSELLSIIVQDLIIHNKDLTNNNNYFNRSPVPSHDSRQLRVDYITAMWKHSDTRSVYVYVVV